MSSAPSATKRSGHARSTEGLAQKLRAMGLLRPVDFCLHLPLRYEDQTHLSLIAEALRTPHEVLLALEILSVSTQYKPRRQLLVRAKDASGEINLRYLNFYGSQVQQFQRSLEVGLKVRAYGSVRGGFLGPEMVHPKTRFVEDETPLDEALTPVYPSVAGVSQAILGRRINAALATTFAVNWQETLDPTVDWPPGVAPWTLRESLEYLHHPPAATHAADLSDRSHPAWRRIKFDELLAQQLSLRLAHDRRRGQQAPELRRDGRLASRLREVLPFTLTAAQVRVAEEISTDLASPFPMQRLLQGDVGSGKTIVAALAACQAIEAGFQVALMAPTEILAEQHYQKFLSWLQPLGVQVVWLTGSLNKRGKAQAKSELEAGAQLVVGTHALFQEDVCFPRLGLVMVDEQHRFGVAQRLALRGKGLNPHQLMMSATPIPRTLAMSYYADLDVSVIDELPPGRTPVRTRLVSEQRRDQVVAFVAKRLDEGRQVYWVCPLIEESESLQLQTALETSTVLQAALPGYSVGLVHGRLKPEEKAAVMAEFVAGNLHVLVATTVIEVGVDVPNASLMVIEHAERFGLSQLHQLRGRVGRGAWASDCVLIYCEPLSSLGRQRLKTIFESTDGFLIAQRDLELRGPGEFVGSRQSGLPMLRYADLLADEDLIQASREFAETMIRKSPELVAVHLGRWFGQQEWLRA